MMEAAYLVTGYNNLSLSLVNSPTSGQDRESCLSSLMDQFLNLDDSAYDSTSDTADESGSTPKGLHDLQGSKLLSQLPWHTPWADFFQAYEPVKVEFQLNEE